MDWAKQGEHCSERQDPVEEVNAPDVAEFLGSRPSTNHKFYSTYRLFRKIWISRQLFIVYLRLN